MGNIAVGGVSCHISHIAWVSLGQRNIQQAFAGMFLICLVLSVPMTLSNLCYESDGSHSVASLVCQQLWIGAN